MKKNNRVFTIILIIAVLLLHTTTVAVAATDNTFSVTMKNLQRDVTLGKGTKAETNSYSRVIVTGGTVNYVYASAYYDGENISEDGDVAVTNGEKTPTKIWYTDEYLRLKKGTSITIKGYQKNVKAKTAEGKVYY